MNSKQIINYTTTVISIMEELRSYATFFPFAKMTKHQINNIRRVQKYLHSPSIDYDAPTRFRHNHFIHK